MRANVLQLKEILKMNAKCLAASGFKRPLSTAEFAANKLVLPQTVRKRLSQTGSYFRVSALA